MHLFLSPHFDDAALSCGGTIHQLTQSNQSARIETIMAGDPFEPDRIMPDSPLIREVHARWKAGKNPVKTRRKEDVAAAHCLGADHTHDWSWTDCIYRTVSDTDEPCYPTEGSIFGEIHPFDFAVLMYSKNANWAFEEPTTVYAPLGAGHHVDHQHVRNLGIAIQRQQHKVPSRGDISVALKFYEEYPYIRDIMAAQHALNILKSLAPNLRLELEIVELSEAAVQAKVEAIACYQTQISSFWPDIQTMEREVREMMGRAGNGVPAERYWQAISKTEE